MSTVLRSTSNKQSRSSNKYNIDMVCYENNQQKLFNRRSAVERLEESKANYVKTERVLDCKQNFEYSSNLHVGGDIPLKSSKSLYNCPSFKYVDNIQLKTENSRPELSDYENSLVPSSEDSLDDGQKQSSLTSDYASRTSSFRCSDRVKNLVKSFESKISRASQREPTVTRSKSECLADAQLQHFFDTLGLDNGPFHSSPPQSPVHFFDSVSSVSSGDSVESSQKLTDTELRLHAPTETSIVEKNARVVKWLYNCHNAYRKSES